MGIVSNLERVVMDTMSHLTQNENDSTGLMFYNVYVENPIVQCPDCETQLLRLVLPIGIKDRLSVDKFVNISPAHYEAGDPYTCYCCGTPFFSNGRIHFKKHGWLPR